VPKLNKFTRTKALSENGNLSDSDKNEVKKNHSPIISTKKQDFGVLS
jgi:hypothetical protein